MEIGRTNVLDVNKANMKWRLVKIFSISMSIFLASGCRTGKQANQHNSNPDSIGFNLRNDTLLSPNGESIYIGKQLIVGKGSGENGRYQAITFKSRTAFPLLFLRNAEIKNDPEYKVAPSARDEDKVKSYLIPGQSLTVVKISSKGDNKVWHYYQVILDNGSNKFSCDIGYAVGLKELLIKP